jgi:tetratricopeptide (TPR) repeat protein
VERILNGLKGNPNLQDEVRDQMPLVWAYYSLKRENYAGAIPHLQSAIEIAKKKSERARLSFILGQIAERDGKYDIATEYYEKVLKNNPDYTLAFNARLSLARAAMESGTSTSSEVTAELEKMLKDEKNAEYSDQIYFTLGKIALHENDIPAAIGYFTLAAEHGAGNPTQLTETNYLLAGLYFKHGDYINAKAAYDATLVSMHKKDARYREVDRLSKNLTDIAMHLSTITFQDSLLRISMMSEEEQLALAKMLYKETPAGGQNQGGIVPVNMKNGAGGKMAVSSPNTPNAPSVRPTPGVTSLQSNFFAYDQKSVKRGQREFEHDWGSRSLVDNWRVAAISRTTTNYDDPKVAVNKPAEVLTDIDVSKILRDVPTTDEQRSAAHEKIQNAMVQLGSLYRDKLEMYPLSIEVLEDFLSRYPDSKYALDAYYQLYLSYTAIGNHAKAEYYKNRIIEEYSSSKYALVLTDPDYMSKQLTEEQRLDRDYQEVYGLVERGAFSEASERIQSAKETFGTTHKLQAKYSILEAMCIGNLEGKEAYIEALKAVIGGYPGTPEEIKARDMLLLLDAYQGSRLNLAKSSGPDFKPGMDAQHFVLVQVTGFKDSDAQDVKVSISNYNRKYHNLDKLKISSLRFDTQGDQVIILVRSFKDGPTAMKYLGGVAKYTEEFVPTGTKYEAFAVTQANYREIVGQKSVESYRGFYNANYN